MIVRTASKMRAHLDDFSGKLSAGLSKPARRFVSEALYGIAARGSVRLAEIGRALEETIALIKTEARLSRNPGRPELRAHLGGAVLPRRQRQDRRADTSGSGHLGYRQALRPEDGIPGSGSRRQHGRARQGLLAVPGDRGGERGGGHRAALQRALFPKGARLPVRERGDQDGILEGLGGL